MKESEKPYIGQRLVTNVRCHECNRVFDLLNDTDAWNIIMDTIVRCHEGYLS